MRSQIFATLLSLIAGVLLSQPSFAQAPGYADISHPSDGETVHDLVTVYGSAFHPSFEYYDLSFAYPGDPTNTWFQIGDRVETPVREGELGIWDTSGISEGIYQLRLQVVLTNGTVIEALVTNLQVSSEQVIQLSTPIPRATGPEDTLSSITETITPTPRPTPILVTTVDGSDRARSVFQRGFLIGGIGLALVGLGLIIRKQYGQYLASLRMREVHRPPSRRKRKRRR
jgi:hypothetical protein